MPRDELPPSAGGTETPGAESSSTTEPDALTTGVKLDVADGQPTGGDIESGCTKVDFLFVIDDSGSMADEQDSLVQSFGASCTGSAKRWRPRTITSW